MVLNSIKLCQNTIKFSYSELKTEKLKVFTQSSTKIVCSSVFNVGGCLASWLTFRPFLTLEL